ncbi:MAG TPA: ATP-binding cassette domain-containing protein [Thermomicrobiales bacterium]|nr:ATP-binding cassette domain-containing protein [Thermomicrobiales bacterium]
MTTHEAPSEQPVVLRARDVSKRFGGVVALDAVGIEVRAGEITGLVGDNGAGKSTFIKILSAVLKPDAGTIEFDGAPVAFASPADARRAGIETVYQDLALAGNMPVWANVFLGRELTRGPRLLNLLDKPRMAAQATEMLGRFSRNMPPIDAATAFLSGGQRQAIAIARAAAWGSKLIIMDEPTAALGPAETRSVEEVIVGLRDRGFAVLIISHNLEQVFRIVDRVWVLRRGRMIGQRLLAETTPEEIVGLITGASTVRRDAPPERP